MPTHFTFFEGEYVKMVHVTIGPRAARAAAYLIRDRARTNLAPHNKSKALSTSLRVRRLPDLPNGVVYEIYSELSYAASVEDGSKPHLITAVNAPNLKFYWEKMGKPMSIKTVHHPGTKPTFFLRRALESLSVLDFIP